MKFVTTGPFRFFCGAVAAALLALAGCDRAGNPAAPAVSAIPLSKVTLANSNQIRLGMSMAQVQTILGPATTAETKDMVIFKKTTYRYEDGAKFILLTFKNDELDSKDSNLAVQ